MRQRLGPRRLPHLFWTDAQPNQHVPTNHPHPDFFRCLGFEVLGRCLTLRLSGSTLDASLTVPTRSNCRSTTVLLVGCGPYVLLTLRSLGPARGQTLDQRDGPHTGPLRPDPRDNTLGIKPNGRQPTKPIGPARPRDNTFSRGGPAKGRGHRNHINEPMRARADKTSQTEQIRQIDIHPIRPKTSRTLQHLRVILGKQAT